MRMSVFEKLPDHVWVVADANKNGLYSIHSKVNPNGKYKTYPNEVELHEAIGMVTEMQKILGLPDEAVVLNANQAVLNKSNVLNRKFKKYLGGRA